MTEKSEHLLHELAEKLEEACDAAHESSEAWDRFVKSMGDAYSEVIELAALASQLAWSLEGDKGEDDERIERRVLMHIEKMGLTTEVQQKLCAHEWVALPTGRTCTKCMLEEPGASN